VLVRPQLYFAQQGIGFFLAWIKESRYLESSILETYAVFLGILTILGVQKNPWQFLWAKKGLNKYWVVLSNVYLV
jgi:hypothetical protein